MDIGSRLVFFLCVLLTCYTAQKYKQTTVLAEGPSPVARVLYSGIINYLAYLLAGLCFFLIVDNFGVPGTESVMSLVFAGGLALIISFLSIWLPKHHYFLNLDMRKMMISVVFLLSLATFTKIDASTLPDFMLHLAVYGGMYFVFSMAYIGSLDRMAIADIPDFLKGLPLAITTLFLMYLSFSFFNGVFFDTLF